MDQLAPSSSLEDNEFFRLLPLLSPALKPNGFEVDGQLLHKRVGALFLATLAALGMAALLYSSSPLTLVAILSSVAPIAYLDSYLSTRAAWQKAVSEFKSQLVPSAIIARQIAAYRFGERSGVDWNKLDENENRVVDYLIPSSLEPSSRTPATVRQMIREGMSYRIKDLLKAVEKRDPSLLKAYLTGWMIRPSDLLGFDQVNLWRAAGSVDQLLFLSRWGLPINARDWYDRTIYWWVANLGGDPSKFPIRMDQEEHMRTLVRLGADPTLTPRIVHPKTFIGRKH